MLYIALAGTIPAITVIHRMVNGVDSFPLLAVPFFIMAGNLMNTAGITERIFDFAKACVGWLHGGLGHVNVAGSVIFAGMSGTAVADAGGLGTIEIKAMRDHGYDVEFAVGAHRRLLDDRADHPAVSAAGDLRVVANVSIGQLSSAGIVPGLVMAAFLMATVALYAWRRGYPRDAKFRLSALWHTGKRAFLPLLTPVIIIGGMMFGLFTPTEAAIAACAYALLPRPPLPLARLAAAGARLLRHDRDDRRGALHRGGRLDLRLGADDEPRHRGVRRRLLSLTQDPIMILLLINLLLLVVGCFMESIAAITILTPVLLPVAVKRRHRPGPFRHHHGAEPDDRPADPAGRHGALRAGAGRHISFEDCVKAFAPFLIPLLLVLALVTFVPWITLWLPTLIYR